MLLHYNDVIMSAMAPEITSFMRVYSSIYSRRRSKIKWKLRVTGPSEGNSTVAVEFPAQMARNVENVSIWWRHHGLYQTEAVRWDDVLSRGILYTNTAVLILNTELIISIIIHVISPQWLLFHFVLVVKCLRNRSHEYVLNSRKSWKSLVWLHLSWIQ